MHAELHPIEEQAPVASFKDAMSALAAGVVLVVSPVEGRPWGTTVTSFASVSADPPTVVVSLRTGSIAARSVTRSGWFGVLVLGAGQRELARACAVPDVAKFLTPDAFAGALAMLTCSVERTVAVDDHTLFVGRVRTALPSHDASAPLVYHRRSYS
jgi:flavin reductase (DIM6/NTAB) family NADH-FMN oxidoreductase RutF